MSSASSPAVPAFSYAQAAQGLTLSNQNQMKSPGASSATSETTHKDSKASTTEPGKLDLNATPIPNKVTKDNPATPEDVSAEQNGLATATTLSGKENVAPQKMFADSEEDAAAGPRRTSLKPDSDFSPQVQAEDGGSTQIIEASESWEKQSQKSTDANKATPASDKEKEKDTEDDWEKISAPTGPMDKELKPAPPPMINFWHQRKADQEAKAKELASQRSSTVAAPAKAKNQASPPGEQTKRKPSEKVHPSGDKDGENGKGKGSETSRQNDSGRRDHLSVNTSRPSSQHKDLPSQGPPPPVGDSESWPTPDTATFDDRRKSASLDKPEKGELKSGGTKSHVKQWKQVPFVPSAVFATPLPPAATKRGGRGGARVRDSIGRGGAHVNNGAMSDKPEPGTMGPPPLPRQQDQERGRKFEAGRGGRAASVPTQGRRNNSTSTQATEFRNTAETPGRERGTLAQVKSFVPEGSMQPSVASTAKPPNSVIASVDEKDKAPATVMATGLVNGFSGYGTEETHAHPAPGTHSRQVASDWYRGSQTTTRPAAEQPKERASTKSREISRDKHEFAREKSDSWREKDAQPDPPSRRELRGERGRGGYRGRGNHQNYATHPNPGQSYTAPLPQRPFSSSKSNTFSEGNHRQSSQPYTMMPSMSGSRNGTRSQSIPTNNNNDNYSQYPNTAPGTTQPLSPIQTDISAYNYSQMHTGVMSAMPYQPHLDQYAMMSMISTQVEYYFSVDNLCKDMFLRSNMDSQGWVAMSVIANFHRIKSLTEDLATLRFVCCNLPTVEFFVGATYDEDRLRRRQEWQSFVLSYDQRKEGARHEGPAETHSAAAAKSPNNAYPRFTDAQFMGAAMPRQTSWNGTGFNGPSARSPTAEPNLTQLDGVIPDSISPPNGATFSPSETMMPIRFGSLANNDEVQPPHMNGTDPAEQTNGHVAQPRVFRDDDETVFPDDRVAELKLVIRKPESAASRSQPQFISSTSRTFSHGSIDGSNAFTSIQNDFSSHHISGLRGGAGSPERLEKLQFTRSTVQDQMNEPMVLWAKDGAAQIVVQQEGMAHEPYYNIRNRAIHQREQHYFGEDINVLYEFWSHFLVRNFNVNMYEEFHTFAIDDMQNGSDTGSKALVRYYEALLSSEHNVSERIARDVVNMAESESGEHRPAFQTLRSAWRDGAFNLKSRKRIGNILTPALRAELDK